MKGCALKLSHKARDEQELRFSRGVFSLFLYMQWNPDFSNPRFPEPSDISNQTLFPLDLLHSSYIISSPISRTLDFWKLPITRTNFGSRRTKLTLDNLNLRKFRNHLGWTSIIFMPLNKLTLPDKLFSRILITQQATNPSVISLKGTMTVFC